MNRNYYCTDCNASTQNPRLFLGHRRDYHGDSISIYECDLCIYASKHSQKVARHRRTVHRGIPTNLSYPIAINTTSQSIAETSARTEDGIANPLGTNEIRLLNCTLCEFRTINKMLLIDHIRVAHPTATIFECPFCSYTHYIKDRFTRHQRYHKMKHVRCHLCEFRTIYKWNLDRHLRHHNDNVTTGYRCGMCNFSATTRQSVTAHETNHHGQRLNEAESNLNLLAKQANEKPFIKSEPETGTELEPKPESKLEPDPEIDPKSDSEEKMDENVFNPFDLLKLVWEQNWANRTNFEQILTNVSNHATQPLNEVEKHEEISSNSLQFFYCQKCNYRNEISTSNNGCPSIVNEIRNSSLSNQQQNYRCGYCHQPSNWKHVIERHCRLVHKTDSIVERYCLYEQTFKRIMPGITSATQTTETKPITSQIKQVTDEKKFESKVSVL